MEPGHETDTVADAIVWADRVLPGTAENDDVRWPAVIAACEHIEANPEEVWDFVVRWGDHDDEDLRDAIACCGLEHLLEYHFDLIFPRVEKLAKTKPLFADMFARCWKFGQTEMPKNSNRFDKLRIYLGFGPLRSSNCNVSESND